MANNQDISDSLIRAVCDGNEEKVKEIINTYGLSYSDAWSEGYNVLCEALQRKLKTVANILLNNNCKVNDINNRCHMSPLHLAVENGYIEIVNILLSKGADIEVKDEYGETPLHCAIFNRDYQALELLLRNKSDIYARDDFGKSLLYYAVKTGVTKIVEILLKYGAVVQPEDVNDQFFYNAIERGFVKIVEDLLKLGADVNKILDDTDYSEQAPLHIAAIYKQENITRLLINYGANLNVQDEKGNTPLFYAVRSGDLNMTKLFLQHQVDINHINKDGMNVLHYTIGDPSEEIEGMVTLLLSHGVDVNVKQKYDGMTALHLAAKYNNHIFIKELLEYCSKNDSKIDINCRNKNGKTPLDIAILNKGEETVRSLLDYGSNINYSDIINQSIYYHRQLNPTIDKVLKSHLVKLKTANLFISTENLILMEDIDDEIKDFENKCEQEIERMKSEKINDTNVSFYDILTRLNKNTSWLRNKNIVDLTTDGYQTKYPIYANMIANEFNKGIRRYNLLGQSIEMWRCVFNNVTPQLPLDCVERVFSYLSYEDLKIFNKCN